MVGGHRTMRTLAFLVALTIGCSSPESGDAPSTADGCVTATEDGSQCCPLAPLDATCASDAYFSNKKAWTCDQRDGKQTYAGQTALTAKPDGWGCLIAANTTDGGKPEAIRTPRGLLYCCNR